MALTPAALRKDAFIGNKKLKCGPGSKPCGNACIPKDNKCRASWNKPVKVAAGVAALTGAAILGTAFLHPRANMRRAASEVLEPALETGFGLGNVARGNWVGAANNAARVAVSGRNVGRNLSTLAQGYGTDIKNVVNHVKTVGFKSRHHKPSMRRTDSAGKRCGQSYISSGKQCQQKGAFPTRKAIAAGLGVAALGVGAYALTRKRGRKPIQLTTPDPWDAPFTPRPLQPAKPSFPKPLPALPGDRTTRQLTGITPIALLPPARRPKSKTQRMRENTATAMRQAESAIGQTAREEVRRVGQIGNTMATTGEAAGMAVKTTLRELRLRTEAARRRFEPGYRRSPAATPKPPAQLSPGMGPAFEVPLNPPRRRSPEAAPIDPRTGQPRRRRARGFGGRTDNYIPVYAPVTLQKTR